MRRIRFKALVQYSGKEKYWEYYDPLTIPYCFTDQGEGFCKIFVRNLEWTGLKDKNGKEIYEGDIVNWDGQNLEVVFCEGSFSIQPWRDNGYHCLTHCVDSDLEIIGNIY